jgi:histone-lysine N-methyltransferase SETD2
VQCIQLFNLAYPVTSVGAPSVSQRDLGLLLEAVALTVNPQTQIVLIEKVGTTKLMPATSYLP